MVDLNHDFSVSTARSAGAQCLPGEVYCTSAFWSSMNSSTSFEVSLSILCKVGLNPRDLHHL